MTPEAPITRTFPQSEWVRRKAGRGPDAGECRQIFHNF